MLWYGGQESIKLQKLILVGKAQASVQFCRWINAMKAHFSDTRALREPFEDNLLINFNRRLGR